MWLPQTWKSIFWGARSLRSLTHINKKHSFESKLHVARLSLEQLYILVLSCMISAFRYLMYEYIFLWNHQSSLIQDRKPNSIINYYQHYYSSEVLLWTTHVHNYTQTCMWIFPPYKFTEHACCMVTKGVYIQVPNLQNSFGLHLQCTELRGWTEKFIGWLWYNGRIWPNAVYFLTSPMRSMHRLLPSCCSAWIPLV